MRRRSTKHHPNIAEIVQSAQHLELLEVSSLLELTLGGIIALFHCRAAERGALRVGQVTPDVSSLRRSIIACH
jgi:hypothetical protein